MKNHQKDIIKNLLENKSDTKPNDLEKLNLEMKKLKFEKIITTFINELSNIDDKSDDIQELINHLKKLIELLKEQKDNYEQDQKQIIKKTIEKTTIITNKTDNSEHLLKIIDSLTKLLTEYSPAASHGKTASNEELEKKKRELEEKETKLQEQIKTSDAEKAEKERLQIELDECQNELNELKAKSEALSADLQRLRETHSNTENEEIRELNRKIQSLQKEINETERIKKDLEKQLELLKTKSAAENENLQNELDTCKKELAQAMIDYETNLSKKSRELNSKNEELGRKITELSEKSTLLNSKTKELSTKSTQLNTKTQELSEKNRQLNSKNEELQKCQKNLVKCEEELSHSTKELESKTKELEECQEKANTVNTETQDLQDQLRDKLAEIKKDQDVKSNKYSSDDYETISGNMRQANTDDLQKIKFPIVSNIFYNISLLIEKMNYQLYKNALTDLLDEKKTTKTKLIDSFTVIKKLLDADKIRIMYNTEKKTDEQFIDEFTGLQFAVTYLYFTVNKVVDMIDTRIMTKIKNYIVNSTKTTQIKQVTDKLENTTLNLYELDVNTIDKIKTFIDDWKNNFEIIKSHYDNQKFSDYNTSPVAIDLTKSENISKLRNSMGILHKKALDFFSESISIIPRVRGDTSKHFDNHENLNFVNAIICLKYFDPTRTIALETTHQASMEMQKDKQGGWWSEIGKELEKNNINLEHKTSKKTQKPKDKQKLQDDQKTLYDIYGQRPPTARPTTARPTTAQRPKTPQTPKTPRTPTKSPNTKKRGGNKNSLYNVIMRKSLKNKKNM